MIDRPVRIQYAASGREGTDGVTKKGNSRECLILGIIVSVIGLVNSPKRKHVHEDIYWR